MPEYSHTPPARHGPGLLAWYLLVGAWLVVDVAIVSLLLIPTWAGALIGAVGTIVITAPFVVRRYRRGAPARAALAYVKRERSNAVVQLIRIDPLTTPVGVERDDSRNITWGLLVADGVGLEVIDSHGTTLLLAAWRDLELRNTVCTEILVVTNGVLEKWWVTLLTDRLGLPMNRLSAGSLVARISRLQPADPERTRSRRR